jgi:hypothetical protein
MKIFGYISGYESKSSEGDSEGLELSFEYKTQGSIDLLDSPFTKNSKLKPMSALTNNVKIDHKERSPCPNQKKSHYCQPVVQNEIKSIGVQTECCIEIEKSTNWDRIDYKKLYEMEKKKVILLENAVHQLASKNFEIRSNRLEILEKYESIIQNILSSPVLGKPRDDIKNQAHNISIISPSENVKMNKKDFFPSGCRSKSNEQSLSHFINSRLSTITPNSNPISTNHPASSLMSRSQEANTIPDFHIKNSDFPVSHPNICPSMCHLEVDKTTIASNYNFLKVSFENQNDSRVHQFENLSQFSGVENRRRMKSEIDDNRPMTRTEFK